MPRHRHAAHTARVAHDSAHVALYAAATRLNTLGMDMLLGCVLPFMLLPLQPGERSTVASAAVSLALAYLNYRAWKSPDQVRDALLADMTAFHQHIDGACRRVQQAWRCLKRPWQQL